MVRCANSGPSSPLRSWRGGNWCRCARPSRRIRSSAAASNARPTRDAEHALRIHPNDFIRAPARVDRKEAPHDMGVATALEDEARRRPGGHTIDFAREPDLTGAAANSVHLRSRRFRQWRQAPRQIRPDGGPFACRSNKRSRITQPHGLRIMDFAGPTGALNGRDDFASDPGHSGQESLRAAFGGSLLWVRSAYRNFATEAAVTSEGLATEPY